MVTMDFSGFSAATLTLLITLICLLVVYGYRPVGFFEKLGIPGPKPVPFLGSLGEYVQGIAAMDLNNFKKYGRIWGFFEGHHPVLATVDTKMIKTIFVKECFTNFTNRRYFRFLGKMNNSLSNVHGATWRRGRSAISPLFSGSRLKEVFVLMEPHSEKLVKNLQVKDSCEEGLDIHEIWTDFCLDALVGAILSIDTDAISNPKNPTVVRMKRTFKFDFTNPILGLSVIFPFLDPLLEMGNLSVFPKADMDSFYAAFEKVKEDREKGVQKDRVDFLKMMLESQLSNSVISESNIDAHGNALKGLTHYEILCTMMIFLLGGLETTSKSLAFVAHSLATNPDVMKKLLDEIDGVLPEKTPLTYEKLAAMEYLDMVLYETLRLYPVLQRLERVCTKTININGVTVPKGTVVTVPLHALHQDPQLWPEPDIFNPERFSKENRIRMDPYAFLPFGAGPRNCIGMRFARILMKLPLVQVLRQFSFAACTETEVPLQLDIAPILSPKNPIKVKLVPRGPVTKG
ncbi:hypothetical protein AGOR_G00243710 [Albula goreensis]|uniref:unspecific monooxygenase n=1 Tax=Albula goreensis TaxID=1534307 RepID=A0A8T3CEC3_9TELE|nr:hypothetical protein AGOR_G00243710 [Albula goreensis]